MSNSFLLVLIAVLFLGASPAAAYIGFAPLLDHNDLNANCDVYGMTPDGHVKVGACSASGAFREPVRWVGSQTQRLGFPPNTAFNYGWGTGVSDDGSVVGGGTGVIATSFRAFRWEAGSWTVLPLYGGCGSWADGVSGDGTRLVGHAIQCSPSTGFLGWLWEAGVFTGVGTGSAGAISSDGLVIVGDSAGEAYRRDSGTTTTLPSPDDDSKAWGLSPNGATVVGTYRVVANGTDRQALWGPDGFRDLGHILNRAPTDATLSDVTGAPFAIVGGLVNEATIWTIPFGLETLESRFAQIGLGPVDLFSARAISDDGRLVVGTYTPGGGIDSWGYHAVLPQYQSVTANYIGVLEIGGYVRLEEVEGDPPERLAATVEFFGTSGGTFASGLTATPSSDPFPLLEELSVELANLEIATDPFTAWTFEFDGILAPLGFTTQFPADTLVPPEEITLFQWDPETQTWSELERSGFDLGESELTVTVPPFDSITHLAFGRTLSDCADDIDNDGDGTIDWNGATVGGVVVPPDPQCTSAVYAVEVNDNCGLGPELVLLLPAVLALRRRGRRS